MESSTDWDDDSGFLVNMLKPDPLDAEPTAIRQAPTGHPSQHHSLHSLVQHATPGYPIVTFPSFPCVLDGSAALTHDRELQHNQPYAQPYVQQCAQQYDQRDVQKNSPATKYELHHPVPNRFPNATVQGANEILPSMTQVCSGFAPPRRNIRLTPRSSYITNRGRGKEVSRSPSSPPYRTKPPALCNPRAHAPPPVVNRGTQISALPQPSMPSTHVHDQNETAAGGYYFKVFTPDNPPKFQPRTRAGKACLHCHVVKQRCLGFPNCQRCVMKGIKCTPQGLEKLKKAEDRMDRSEGEASSAVVPIVCRKEDGLLGRICCR